MRTCWNLISRQPGRKVKRRLVGAMKSMLSYSLLREEVIGIQIARERGVMELKAGIEINEYDSMNFDIRSSDLVSALNILKELTRNYLRCRGVDGNRQGESISSH